MSLVCLAFHRGPAGDPARYDTESLDFFLGYLSHARDSVPRQDLRPYRVGGSTFSSTRTATTGSPFATLPLALSPLQELQGGEEASALIQIRLRV